MTTHLTKLALVLGIAMAFPVTARMQDKAAAPKPPVVPLKIHVVISRYQGDKKISSLPYSMSLTGGAGGPERGVMGASFVGHANLRMGTKIPVSMMAPPSVDGKPLQGIPTAGPIQYQDVGTNIDCNVWTFDDGRFRLEITIDDTSVYPDDKKDAAPTNPSFRSFRASDSMILKDGGTAQFTTATDKVSGEIVKVDVTLTVVK